jgi:biotin transporter BioY
MMRLGQNPLFRKAIVPWYDSETVCLIVILFLVVVFLFGLAGISVARDISEYREHMWVAVLLAVLSGGVVVSTSIRLITRYVRHRSSK